MSTTGGNSSRSEPSLAVVFHHILVTVFIVGLIYRLSTTTPELESTLLYTVLSVFGIASITWIQSRSNRESDSTSSYARDGFVTWLVVLWVAIVGVLIFSQFDLSAIREQARLARLRRVGCDGGSGRGKQAAAKTTAMVPATGEFGGPYTVKQDQLKLINFSHYKRQKLSYSKSVVLTKELFVKSIKTNQSCLYGGKYQSYNFAMDGDGDIKVAVWTKAVPPLSTLKGIQGKTALVHKKGRMINFYCESPSELPGHNAESPFWLIVPTSNGFTKVGFLDAMSKHFMLAQPVGTKVTDFDGPQWLSTTVSYAGEIVVDVKNDSYALTDASGTYRPNGTYLGEVAAHFEKQLGIAPAYLQSFGNSLREYKADATISN